MRTILLVDGNNIGYAAQNSPALTYEGQPIHALFHSLKMLKTALRAYSSEKPKMIVLWDGRAQWRFDLYPEYKSNRGKDSKGKEMKEQFKLQQPKILKALKMLGVDQIVGKGYEADDVAGFLSKAYSSQGNKVVLISGDKDWIQLVNGVTTWYDPVRERFVRRSNFEEFTGVQTVEQFVQTKAIEGDSSDMIAGVPGLGEKACIGIMQNFGSVENLFAAYEANGGDFEKGQLPDSLSRPRNKINDFCREGREVFYRNMKLMDLRNVPVERDQLKVVKGQQDFIEFRQFCLEHAFHSIIREMVAWENLFGEVS